MRSNLQIYTDVHEFDFRCRQTEEHASVLAFFRVPRIQCILHLRYMAHKKSR